MKGAAPETSKEFVPPHKRNAGWDGWELEEAARHLLRAREISGNPKFLKAIEDHMAKRAEEHRGIADHAKMLAKAGRISPRAMEKMGKA